MRLQPTCWLSDLYLSCCWLLLVTTGARWGVEAGRWRPPRVWEEGCAGVPSWLLPRWEETSIQGAGEGHLVT